LIDRLDLIVGRSELCTVRFEPTRRITMADFKGLVAIVEEIRAGKKKS
jgi:hypothetical protein